MSLKFNPMTQKFDLVNDPADGTGSIQFNNGGVFGGDSNLVWDNTNYRLSLGVGNTLGGTNNFSLGNGNSISNVSGDSNIAVGFSQTILGTTANVLLGTSNQAKAAASNSTQVGFNNQDSGVANLLVGNSIVMGSGTSYNVACGVNMTIGDGVNNPVNSAYLGNQMTDLTYGGGVMIGSNLNTYAAGGGQPFMFGQLINDYGASNVSFGSIITHNVNTVGNFAMGICLETSSNNVTGSVTIGCGDLGGSYGYNLINDIDKTIMFGLNSDIPTMTMTAGSGKGSTGKIGICTKTPSDTLQVNGTIRSSSYKSSDGSAGITATITTAKLTLTGANGSQTFKNGLLVAQTPAT